MAPSSLLITGVDSYCHLAYCPSIMIQLILHDVPNHQKIYDTTGWSVMALVLWTSEVTENCVRDLTSDFPDSFRCSSIRVSRLYDPFHQHTLSFSREHNLTFPNSLLCHWGGPEGISQYSEASSLHVHSSAWGWIHPKHPCYFSPIVSSLPPYLDRPP